MSWWLLISPRCQSLLELELAALLYIGVNNHVYFSASSGLDRARTGEGDLANTTTTNICGIRRTRTSQHL